ncbi:MAG: GRP family sugar transporter [Patescibacteria group bacterium]
MSWIILTLITIIIWSIVNIFDKHIVDKEIRNPYVDTIVFSFAQFVFLLAFGIYGLRDFSPTYFYLAIVAGIVYFVATYFYYSAMKKEQVSTLAPILGVEPAIVALLAFLFLSESLSFFHYLAILIIIVGAWLISYEKNKKLAHVHWLSFLAMVAFAGRNVLIKAGADLALPFGAICLGLGLGGLMALFVAVLLAVPHFDKHSGHSIRKLLFVSALSAIGFVFYAKAISIGSVSLVSALLSVKPVVVFALSLLLSRFNPKFLHEKMDRKQLLTKIAAIVLIIIGGVMLVW